MHILKNLLQSVLVTLVFAVVCCGFYPVLIWSISQLIFPHQANGSLIHDSSGALLGSELLGQNFNGDTYFNPRPSAAGTIGYDPTSSGGTNLGPTSQKLMDSIKAAVSAYRQTNNLPASQLVPEDAVTSSGSGLDPHISLKNALLQAPRVAAKRGIAVADVQKLVARYTDGRSLGIFGEPGVNVVMLNLALDGKIK